MDNLKEKYDEIMEQREEIIREINSLEETEILKKYFQLKSKNENLYYKSLDLCREMDFEKYGSCKHILVYSKIDYDRFEGRTYKSCGCIKCGLDNSVLDIERKYLPFKNQIMYDYLKSHYLSSEFDIKFTCDLNLAHAIYSKIKEVYPNIDDKMAMKYFEIALNDIRNIKVNDERKKSRAKRLLLDSNFKNWDSKDVCCD